MAVVPKEAPTAADLICAVTGHRHAWDYIRGFPGRDGGKGQPSCYKCQDCYLVLAKNDLKRLTDGGEA